jgi:glutamate-1-semialdehyde 2,1-aminomutase
MTPAEAVAAGAWLDRAARVTPGGVHSPVRAFKAMGVPPLGIVSARGARVTDADGRQYIDWIGAWDRRCSVTRIPPSKKP